MTQIAIVCPLIFIVLAWPLIIASLVFWTYGCKQSMPVCSCSAIRKAYKNNLDKLPENCRMVEDPFEKTPFWIRNSFHIRQAVTLAIFIASARVFLLQILKTGQKASEEIIIVSVVALVHSAMCLCFDRNFCLVDRALSYLMEKDYHNHKKQEIKLNCFVIWSYKMMGPFKILGNKIYKGFSRIHQSIQYKQDLISI